MNTRRISDLEPGTTYSIRIRAQSHSGETSPTDGTAEVTITIPAAETVRADRPTNLSVHMVDRTTVRLTWTEQENRKDKITGYRIYRKAAGAPGRLDRYDNVLVSNTGSTATTFTDHTGTPGTTYEYGISVRWDSERYQVQGMSTTALARPW